MTQSINIICVNNKINFNEENLYFGQEEIINEF